MRRARALAERASSQENLSASPSSNEWPAPPPPVPQSRESLFNSFLRSVETNRAEAQAPSEGSSIHVSWCASNHSVDSQDEGRLALNPELNLTLVSFSCVQKHFSDNFLSYF